MSEKSTNVGRLNVNITEATSNHIDHFIQTHGMTRTEIVRRAISIYNILESHVSNGYEIHLVKKNGTPEDTVRVELI